MSNHDGIVRFDRMNTVTNIENQLISVSHLGKILVIDENDDNNILEEYKVEYAATVHVRDGQKIALNTKIMSWDQFNNPLISTAKGVLHYENFIKDITFKEEYNDITFTRDMTIIESKDRKKQPQFRIVGEDGSVVLVPVPAGLVIKVEDGSFVHTGDILGQTSRMTIKQRDITGGLPRVQDLFEARVPKDKAKISDIEGIVTIGGLKKTGRDIFVTPSNGIFAPFDGKVVVQSDEFVNQIAVLSPKTVYSRKDGKVTIVEEDKKKFVHVARRNAKPEIHEIPKGLQLIVSDGDSVKVGTPLCGKVLQIPAMQESILVTDDTVKKGQPLAGRKYSIPTGKRITVHRRPCRAETRFRREPWIPRHAGEGIIEAQLMILNEIQEIYRKQGVKIDDKHQRDHPPDVQKCASPTVAALHSWKATSWTRSRWKKTGRPSSLARLPLSLNSCC